MDPVLRAYKAEIFAANVSRANKTVKFSRVLAAIDYAPQLAMLLAAAVLSIICIFLYVIIITKWSSILRLFAPYFCLVYESIWVHEGSRYVSFGLALTCLFTAFLCVKAGGLWWMFYTSLFIQVLFTIGRLLKALSGYRYIPSDDLEDVTVDSTRAQRILVDEPVEDTPGRPVTRSISRRSTATNLYRTQN